MYLFEQQIGLVTCLALDYCGLWISFQAAAVIISNWNVVSELVDLQLAWMMIGGLWIQVSVINTYLQLSLFLLTIYLRKSFNKCLGCLAMNSYIFIYQQFILVETC